MWFKILLLFSIFFVLTTSRHLNSNGYGNNGEMSQNSADNSKELLMAASNGYQKNEQQQQFSNIRIKRDKFDREWDKASDRADSIWGMTKTVFIVIIVLICLCALCCIIGLGAGIYYIVKKANPPPPPPPPQNGYYQQQQQPRAY